MPIRIYQLSNRIEILNAGGLYGEARPENSLMVNDYRNPIIAEAMRGMKYVDMFNRGIQCAKNMLRENGNPGPIFNVGKVAAFEVTIQPSLSLNLVTDGEKVIRSVTKSAEVMNEVIALYQQPKSLTEIITYLGPKHRNNAKSRYIDPLIKGGFLEMTIPDRPNSRDQEYISVLSQSFNLATDGKND